MKLKVIFVQRKEDYEETLPEAVEVMSDFETKYAIVFWLNPWEQRIHHSGWFTVEELELWAENKGPVMKEIK